MATRKTGSATPKEDSRLSRIRENQRRSRARKREYLEDLENRWKRCQELGVQANVELQKAAKRVIEENTLLRKMLVELGLETAQIDKRLEELKSVVIDITNADDHDISGDNGCCTIPGGNTDGVSANDDMITSLEGFQFSQPPSELDVDLLGENTEESSVDPPSVGVNTTTQTHVNGNPAPLATLDPIFDMDLLETVPDYDTTFDITQFLEMFDPSPSPSTTGSIIFTDQQLSESLNQPIDVNPTPSILLSILPQACIPDSCISKPENTTPCTEVYALLKALNAQRQEHKDMFQIVLELWNGFCYPEPGEEGSDGKGCRVDNDTLQKVIDGLNEVK